MKNKKKQKRAAKTSRNPKVIATVVDEISTPKDLERACDALVKATVAGDEPKPDKFGYVLPAGKSLVLRICASTMISHSGFVWPSSGEVSAPDWSPRAECGYGLHGWLWGRGKGATAPEATWKDPDKKWLVVEVETKSLVDLDGGEKVKFPRGSVIFCGDRDTALERLKCHAPAGPIMIGYSETAGYSGTATAGYRGTATAGDRGTATAGDRGTATAGYSGTATAGDSGTATAGYSGTATAGYSGTALIKADLARFPNAYGTIAIKWVDKCGQPFHSWNWKYRTAYANVDVNGEYKPNVAYICDENGKIIPKPEAK